MSINMNGDILSNFNYTPNNEVVYPNIVTDGLIGWWDWGNHQSWIDSDTNYYRCASGYGCDYYATTPADPNCYHCSGMTLDMSGHRTTYNYLGKKGNDMRHRGNSTVVERDVGKALYLNGTSGTYLSSIDFNEAADVSGEVTIMVWVNHIAVNSGNLVTTNFNSGYRCRVTSAGAVWFYVSGNSIQSSNGVVTTGNWDNICFDGDASGLTAYVNNTQAASNSTAFNPSGSGYLFLGSYNGSSEMLNAYMGLVLLYDKKLSTTERTQCYQATRPRFIE